MIEQKCYPHLIYRFGPSIPRNTGCHKRALDHGNNRFVAERIWQRTRLLRADSQLKSYPNLILYTGKIYLLQASFYQLQRGLKMNEWCAELEMPPTSQEGVIPTLTKGKAGVTRRDRPNQRIAFQIEHFERRTTQIIR